MEKDNQTYVTQPGLPEGYSLRSVRLSDIEEIVDLFNVVARAMKGEDDFDVNALTNDLQNPGVDLDMDTRVVLNEKGRIVAYQDVFADEPVPVHPVVWGRVHLDHMGLGLGSSLFEWGKKRARHVLDKVPGEARVALRAFAPNRWIPGKELLEDQGLKPIRHYFEMAIEMDEKPADPTWPDDITLHRYNHPDEGLHVYRAVEDAFRDHFGYVEWPEEEGFKRFGHMRFKDADFDPSLWFLAKQGDQIAGFVLNRNKGSHSIDTGYVQTLGVLRPWRNQGLGLALLKHSFATFWARGQKRVTLDVDGKNLTGAVRLYEKAGMHIHRQLDLYELELRPGIELATTELEGR